MKNGLFLLFIFFSLNTSWAIQKRVFDLKTPETVLRQQEFKKFEAFKQQLKQQKLAPKLYLNEIRNYSKDSLRILAVKLSAVKELHETGLLAKDIHLNPEYYTTLLDELKESDIQNSEYSFLQNQLYNFRISEAEHKLNLSTKLNYIFLFICIVLGYFVLRKKKSKITETSPTLSNQEEKVKNQILEGKTNKEIAEILFVSVNTVKTHITNIYHKLSVNNRRELIAKYQNSTGTSS